MRFLLIAGVSALAVVLICEPSAAQPASAPAPASIAVGQPVQIDRNGVLILIRSTILAVDHANRTGNYTVLRDLGAPGFGSANTATRLGEIFANMRSQNIDLSGIAVLEPQLTTLPTTVQGGMMRMAGFFPSVPLQVNFDLLFAPVEGRWRLFGVGLNLSQSGPSAPSGPQMRQPPAPQPSSTPAPPSAEVGAGPDAKPTIEIRTTIPPKPAAHARPRP